MFKYIQQLWAGSIRRQLMLGIILVHAVLMSIFVYDLVERQRNFLHLQSVEQASSLATTLAANSTSWVLANDVIGLEEILEAQINYPALRYAMVLSPKGRVLGHTEKEKVGLYINDAISGKLLTANKEQIVLINNNLSIDIASPILSNDVFIGWARVNLTQIDNAKNLQVITRDGLLYTFLAIVVGALFAFFMAKGITRGLKHIVDVAEGVEAGDFSLRSNLNRHDELGKLGEDFNIMLDAVSKSKRDLQGIMDNSPTVIYVKDVNGFFTFVNQQFKKLFHLSDEKVIGKTLYDIFPKAIAEEMQGNDKDVLETGQPLESEEHAPQKDGMHTYSSVKFPLYDENEKIYAVCGISTDITERVKMENEKSSLETQLLHSQKMQAIGQLTGGIAHDFNNLLAVILGYAELSKAKFGQGNEVLAGHLDQIHTAGTRGRKLIEQMMMYSRKDLKLDVLTPMKIEPVIEETSRMLRATFPTTINIKTSIEVDMPFVLSNAGLLSQMLMNLCINAKDGMGEEGELFISLSIEKYNHDVCNSCHEPFAGEFVVINVKDNGSGIPENILERIFEPFFTSKNVGEGTGMGLSVVHGIVHKLGGHILVTSKVNEGTSFKILLPISDEKIKTENIEGINQTKYDFSNLTLMIVDDEPAVAGLLEAVLKQNNAILKVFTDSQQALKYFEKEPEKIDIVITDQTMPDLTGAVLSEKLLALRADIPIILCTGHSAEITEETAHQLGIKAFIYKPIEIEKLLRIINELR